MIIALVIILNPTIIIMKSHYEADVTLDNCMYTPEIISCAYGIWDTFQELLRLHCQAAAPAAAAVVTAYHACVTQKLHAMALNVCKQVNGM